ncbi:MAG: ABC transporter ATP-binding protein [Anaerolineae bacterium]|nr:ABC transporter ATP-binding protein [Anaerolineae bacterium]
MTAIRVEGLRKRFGQVQALDGLTFTVQQGAVFGFLGPNGAGKTTTIRILTGLARPSGGRAWVLGMDVSTARREIARRIGYLPEEPVFYPWMTARELLDHVGRMFGLPGRERRARVNELLDQVGLSQVGGRRIGAFSRGMRQRLGIAQALINRPALLFLDEPMSALDPAGRREVLELLDRLRADCSILMSTHVLSDVERVCDTVGIIARGRMVIEAPREELLARYAAPAFEIEGEPGNEGALAAWAEGLRNARWAMHVAVVGTAVRVVASDVAAAKRELLPSAVAAGLTLARYEIARPSLEDVFLQLVGAGEVA